MQVTNTAHQRARRSPILSSWFTSKIALAGKLLILLVGGASSPLHANTGPSSELSLSCSVHSDNFGMESGLLVSKEVSIKGSVLKQNGHSLVYETENLEFWALTHMTQKLNGDHFINNFEVAIRDKNTNRFYNALSDSVFSADESPRAARIRLANYHPGTFHEKSYVMFECQNTAE